MFLSGRRMVPRLDSSTPSPSNPTLRPTLSLRGEEHSPRPLNINPHPLPPSGPPHLPRHHHAPTVKIIIHVFANVQSALEMVFYGAFTVFGILVIPGQEWFWPSEVNALNPKP